MRADLAHMAATSTCLEDFIHLAFPPTWRGIACRILETGATFSPEVCPWAPRWTEIPHTQKRGKTEFESDMKTIMFRMHDCLHQLWGLPYPGQNLTQEDFYYYKRGQMCGEVAVLTLTEFMYGKYLWDTYPDCRDFLDTRNAVPLLRGALAGKDLLQLGARLDDLLHKKSRPLWVRHSVIATAFCDDYVPMLECDRDMIDKAWTVFQNNPEFVQQLKQAPRDRYGRNLDGLELTLWMLSDFQHLLTTEPDIDVPLMTFNRERRAKIQIPKEWPV